MLRLISLLAVLSACGHAHAQYASAGHGSGSQTPTQQWARVGDAETIEFVQSLTKPVYKHVEYTYEVKVPFVTPDGKQEVRPETRSATRAVRALVNTTIVSAADETTRYFEVDGRPVDPRVAAQRLTSPTLVLVSATDSMPPSYYAGLFKTGTLVATLSRGGYTQPIPQIAPPIASNAQDQGAAQPSSLVHPDAGPAPLFRFARLGSNGKIRLRDYTEQSHDEQTTKLIPAANGQPARPATVAVRRVTQINNILEFNSAEVEVTMANGTPVGSAALTAMLAGETTVLASADGQPVDRFWLTNVKPTTLVIVAPLVNASYQPGPMPGFEGAPYHVSPPPAAAPVTVPKPAPMPAPMPPPSGAATDKPQV
jgi:hypothetical protein